MMKTMMKTKTMMTMTISFVYYFIELGKFQLSQEEVKDVYEVHSNAR